MTLSYHIARGRKESEKSVIVQGSQATSETDRGFNRLGSQ